MSGRNAKWMPKEDDQLRSAAASGEAVSVIAKRLCRSERGVRHRAQTLGVKLPSLRRFGSSRRLRRADATGGGSVSEPI